MIAWRHGPVVAGGAAAPDSPSRKSLPEPGKLGILSVLALLCVHDGRRTAVPERAGGWDRYVRMVRELPPGRKPDGARRAHGRRRTSRGPAWGKGRAPLGVNLSDTKRRSWRGRYTCSPGDPGPAAAGQGPGTAGQRPGTIGQAPGTVRDQAPSANGQPDALAGLAAGPA